MNRIELILQYYWFLLDVEDLESDMVEAFDSVLMLLPRPPSNPKYNDFLGKSRQYSYQAPFNAPIPPYPKLNIPVLLKC